MNELCADTDFLKRIAINAIKIFICISMGRAIIVEQRRSYGIRLAFSPALLVKAQMPVQVSGFHRRNPSKP